MTDEFATPNNPPPYVPRGDAEDRAEVPRDQWDRYLMPHLDGTKPARNKGFTRVSTIKSGLSNQTGIKVWTGEMIVKGLGEDPELVAEAKRAGAIIDTEAQKKAYRKIADKAFVKGGGKDRSGKGTEFHEVTETINRGGEVHGADLQHLTADLSAYFQLLEQENVQILPDMLERQVLCPYNSAGTFDNMVRWWNPDTGEYELVIGDLKTGRDLSKGWLEILIQLWMYANAYGLWTTTEVIRADDGTIVDIKGFYEPMPAELRRDKGIIFHVPLDGTATMYVLDLSGVALAVEAAVTAKRWNAEAKHKVRVAGQVRPDAFTAPVDGGPNPTGQDPTDADGRTRAITWSVPSQDTTITSVTFDGGPGPVTQADVALAPPADPIAAAGYPALSGAIADQAARTKTADQLEQERIRDERLAKVSAMSNPNDDGDDISVDAPSVQGRARVADLPPERDPVTGRKKRTCGHCRKPGHTQKNCPRNPASVKYVSPADAALAEIEQEDDANADQAMAEHMLPAGAEVLAALPPLPESAYGPDAVPLPEPELTPTIQAVQQQQQDELNQVMFGVPPWCHLAHAHEWTSTHPAAPGQWVCATTGKPSREVYEKNGPGTATSIIEHPGVGTEMVIAQNSSAVVDHHPDQPGPAEVTYSENYKHEHIAPGYTIVTPLPTPPAWAEPSPTVDHRQVVLGRIESCQSQAEVLRLRADAIAAGHWLEALHDGPAMAKYQSLS